MKATVEYIPTKLRANMKIVSLCSKRNLTTADAQKLNKAQNELINQKEQIDYIQDQINKIRNSVKYRQSQIVWQTINEVSKKKSTSRAKQKAVSHEERIHGNNITKIFLENSLNLPINLDEIPSEV